MSNKTGIEWTDATWNPVRGCSRVSEGCRNCYAEGVAYRFSGAGGPYEGLAHQVNGHASWTGKVELVEKHLLDPLRGREPRRIFVNSMSDLFHENVPDEMLDRIFAVMALCPQHQFQVLTKRPERMLSYMRAMPNGANIEACKMVQQHWPTLKKMPAGLRWNAKGLPAYVVGAIEWPLPNVWQGVSVEDQKTADERIPLLLQTPAAVRFISGEPLLRSIRLPRKVFLPRLVHGDFPIGHNLFVKGEHLALSNPHGALSVRAQGGQLLGIKPGEFEDRGIGLDWVIVGGESGPGARPCSIEWIRSIRDQCKDAGVPVFIKQLGAVVIDDPIGFPILKDRKGGDWSEWPEDLRVREFPKEAR